MDARCRIRLEVKGIVQGVGFRPFVHRLTRRFHLCGWVRNTASGAELELEGGLTELDAFVAALRQEQPPLAVITHIRRMDGLPLRGESGFRILHSTHTSENDAMISPDVAICPDCRRELSNPADRRYRYPFLNCTNCGPRFTILRNIPYDRANTSMAAFPMCVQCAREYGEIENRRYHAQPDCCWVCGPQVSYLDGTGTPCPGEALEQAKLALQDGKIVAVKGLGGFHLACMPNVAGELRRRKQRDGKPFAVMCPDIQSVQDICELSPEEELALTSHQAPIVLLKKRAKAPSCLSETGEIGVMLPYTPLHVLLMEDFPCLIMTSANVSDCPVIISDREAVEGLRGIADGFLMHNREIVTRCDDSLIRLVKGKPYPIRRSRGYVPQALMVEEDVTGILACGAEQKASFCLGKGRAVFASQHIGDLNNAETLAHYEEQISNFSRLFGVIPRRLVCDLHPDYLSTQYAVERSEREGLPLLRVQHHHAHMVSCMADNGLDGPCLGLIWDGVGYGTDGTIWGAECLAGDALGVQRVGSIRPLLLPGGDLCTREIDRVTHSLLWNAGLAAQSPVNEMRKTVLEQQLASGLNVARASSMGRLFDGIYGLISGRSTVTYEGQGAVLLEAMATEETKWYPLSWEWEDGRMCWDVRPMVQAVVADLHHGVPAGEIAAFFLNTLVQLGRAHCAHGRERFGYHQVVLSGGVFQNMYLLSRLEEALCRDGFAVFYHSRVPTNDEGIGLGQMMIAAKEGMNDVPCHSIETGRS